MIEKPMRVIGKNRLLRGIITGVLLIPGVKKCFEKIAQSCKAAQVKKELHKFDGKQEAGKINFRHYLPNTEARIERLRRVINARPVAILLPGPSIGELERRISELENCDICYFGVNDFRIMETYILQKINRNLSLAMCTAAPGERLDDNIDFLERREDNIFVSERGSFQAKGMPEGFHLGRFMGKYDKKLLFLNTVPIPVIDGRLVIQVPTQKCPLHFPRQNSLSILLALALIGEASKVVIFGGDGGKTNTGELYFRPSDPGERHFAPEQAIVTDTRVFNETMPSVMDRIYKIYNLRPVEIINCSVQSHYTPFRKTSYDEVFNLLKHFAR